MRCPLDNIALIRRTLNRDYPGWTVEYFPCQVHDEDHEIRADVLQPSFVRPGPVARGAAAAVMTKPAGRVLDNGLFCTHATAANPLVGNCAFCGTRLHVHQADLGAVKSGRAGTGFLEEKCPACHRPNAVHAAYGLGGIRTSRIVEGGPAMQMKFRVG